jgi:hypothetical protein
MNKYYKYKGLQFLKDRFNKNTNLYDNIHICAYDVNNYGKYPFQRFLLINTEHNKILKFPTVTMTNKFLKNSNNFSNSNTYTDEFINFVKVSLFGLFQLYIDDISTFNSGLSFNGFYEYENNLYLFFDVTNCNIKINDLHTLWFVTIEEIMNVKYCCDMPIAEIVTDFFIQNNSFCFLLDENNNHYEIPMIGYVGKPENKLQFTFIFGETRDYNNGIFGPYYYFTNFYSALKDGLIHQINKTGMDNIIDLSLIDEDGYYIRGGIVRFAIFTGLTKFIENNPLDPIDNSEIKQQQLQDKRLDQNFERLTMRITDYDGKWTQSYDSVILGKIELDNGTYIPDINIVVKELCQQIPLSYHYVDKDILNRGNSNSEITDYLII